MKKPLMITALSSLLISFSQISQAHPGHDHSHWTSEPIHILTMVSIGTVIIGALVYKQLIRKSKVKLQQKETNHDA